MVFAIRDFGMRKLLYDFLKLPEVILATLPFVLIGAFWMVCQFASLFFSGSDVGVAATIALAVTGVSTLVYYVVYKK